MRAVIDVYGGTPHPGLKVIYTQRNILSVVLVEDPDLTIAGWLGYTMTIVVE